MVKNPEQSGFFSFSATSRIGGVVIGAIFMVFFGKKKKSIFSNICSKYNISII